MSYVRGAGDYTKVADWRWQWYPPPYRAVSPVQAPKSNYYPTYASASEMGLGCAGGCSCGGTCGKGMGLTHPGPWQLGFTQSDIGDQLQSLINSVFSTNLSYNIPNWVPYGLLGLLVVPKLFSGGRRRR